MYIVILAPKIYKKNEIIENWDINTILACLKI